MLLQGTDKMTMSLFHNLKLKRRKVDSRSSSDGSEVAVTDMISPPSLASSSEVSTDDNAHNRPSPGFEVEVKPNKFELKVSLCLPTPRSVE